MPMKTSISTPSQNKPDPKPRGSKKPIGPATRAWMTQERLFRDMLATF